MKPITVEDQVNVENVAAIDKAISELFPIATPNYELSVSNIHPKIVDIRDTGKQKQLKMEGRSLTMPIKANMTLRDKRTGKKQSADLQLLNLPAMTPRGTYLINGTEYQIVNQFKLKSGVFVYRPKFTGDPEAYFNFARRGKNFRIVNKEGVLAFKVNGSHIPVYPYLKEMGYTDSVIGKAWGSDVLEQNKGIKITEARRNKLLSYLGQENIMDPQVTEITLGKPYDRLNPEAILRAGQKLFNVIRGTEKPDRRDALYFKEVLKTSDLLYDRMKYSAPRIKKRISSRMEKYKALPEAVDFSMFAKPVYQLMVHSKLSEVPSEVNPIIREDSMSKITPMGEGGIEDLHAISLHTRNVDPSYLGFIDPVHSPEGRRVGITNYLTPFVTLKDRNMFITVRDKKGRKVEVSPLDLKDKWLAFEKPHSPAEAMRGEEIRKIPGKQVDYYLQSPSDMFSTSAMLIPFISSNAAVRDMVATKIMGQSLPLKYRQKARVQNEVSPGKSIEQAIGASEALFSPVGGTVTRVGENDLYIQSDDDKSVKIPYYNNFPLNKGSLEHHEIRVKKGDRVRKGQLLADSIFTRDGELALGTSLRTAYVPFRGFSMEDGVVVSDEAAKKLTSYHLYEKKIPVTDGSEFSRDKYVAYYPGDLEESNVSKLDNQGVVKPGQIVTRGDTVIAGLRKKTLTPDEVALGKLSKRLLKDHARDIETWDRDVQGEVLYVARKPKSISVFIKTEEPAVAGDKICNLYGGKTVITKVVPGNEMPRDKAGESMEVLYNPLGVPSRMNLGQLIETGLQKLMDKQGREKVIVNKFTDNNVSSLLSAMKAERVPVKEPLYDPVAKRWLDYPVFTGKQNILKLEHKVNTKFSARGLGPSYDESMRPVAGGSTGCFPRRSYVDTEDGPIDIRDIVRNKMNVRVLSRDDETGTLEYKPIANYFKRRRTEPFVKVKSGKNVIYPTMNHEIYSEGGKKQAGLGIKAVYHRDLRLNDRQVELLYGTLLGDSTLSSRSESTARISWSHCIKQKPYSDYKRQLFGDAISSESYDDNVKATKVQGKTTYQLKHIFDKFYPNGKKVVPLDVDKYLTPEAIALWYMDDGSFTRYKENRNSIVCNIHAYAFIEEDIDRLINVFSIKYKIEARKIYDTKRNGYMIRISRLEALKFIALVAPYVIESMKYKCGLDQVFSWNQCVVCGKPIARTRQICNKCLYVLIKSRKCYQKYYNAARYRFGSIKDVRSGIAIIEKEIPEIWNGIRSVFGTGVSELIDGCRTYSGTTKVFAESLMSQTGWVNHNKMVYNIEVKDNHNYFVSGILVGNSKAMDLLSIYAMLAHGSNANLKEMNYLKGENNPEIWRMIQLGYPPPTPKPTFAFQKFKALLRGVGVDVRRNDNQLQLLPFTDDSILELSHGEIRDPEAVVRGKNLETIPDGLYDRNITGGLRGENWSHIALASEIPNPVFEGAVLNLLNMKQKDFRDILEGKRNV